MDDWRMDYDYYRICFSDSRLVQTPSLKEVK